MPGLGELPAQPRGLPGPVPGARGVRGPRKLRGQCEVTRGHVRRSGEVTNEVPCPDPGPRGGVRVRAGLVWRGRARLLPPLHPALPLVPGLRWRGPGVVLTQYYYRDSNKEGSKYPEFQVSTVTASVSPQGPVARRCEAAAASRCLHQATLGLDYQAMSVQSDQQQRLCGLRHCRTFLRNKLEWFITFWLFCERFFASAKNCPFLLVDLPLTTD